MKAKKIKRRNLRPEQADMMFLTVSESGNFRKANTEKEIQNAVSGNCIVVCNDIFFQRFIQTSLFD